MHVADLSETWLAQLAAEAAALQLAFDTRYIAQHPDVCPVCGQNPALRNPYPGVVLDTYYDVRRARVIPFWACKTCVEQWHARRPGDDDRLLLRIRHRLDEFLVDP